MNNRDNQTEMDELASNNLSRRNLLRGAATGVAAIVAARMSSNAQAADAPQVLPIQGQPLQKWQDEKVVLKGQVNQSACKWCYGGFSIEQLAQNSAKMGLHGMDLVDPAAYPILKQYGLIASMTNSHPIDPGLNHPENHVKCLAAIRNSVEAAGAAGFPSVICFSGNRKGMSDEEGLKHCADALKQVVGLAEQKKVTICMELLNSKVNHPDYMCDRTEWGINLVKAVGSENFKLLYDIYHMQIMEGDVIATIKKHHEYFGHYHTGGVPGRNEIDDSQELNYAAIIKAILDTGYKGFLGQEFIPKRDPMTSLAQAARICDV
ncbi:MAG: TIM barrel protein [Abitibacteriaceae bacterium]|nr:TIM barrel protein [Abditibacteriaceae bacterium]